eukprot:CAMPEP_0178836526 /NCGR_PEP_ID=MMETSP0746-20121128/12242_1 /TAXON_ID=913974 /ORGANISM="Nitzschia punctata, Strain CCMP561" /LENGTH=495 /DNA_ID=CAMNT_0020499243 /DNA_START=91 /DNA_END=1578 /DNA_ORIENTATION=+
MDDPNNDWALGTGFGNGKAPSSQEATEHNRRNSSTNNSSLHYSYYERARETGDYSVPIAAIRENLNDLILEPRPLPTSGNLVRVHGEHGVVFYRPLSTKDCQNTFQQDMPFSGAKPSPALATFYKTDSSVASLQQSNQDITSPYAIDGSQKMHVQETMYSHSIDGSTKPPNSIARFNDPIQNETDTRLNRVSTQEEWFRCSGRDSKAMPRQQGSTQPYTAAKSNDSWRSRPYSSDSWQQQQMDIAGPSPGMSLSTFAQIAPVEETSFSGSRTSRKRERLSEGTVSQSNTSSFSRPFSSVGTDTSSNLGGEIHAQKRRFLEHQADRWTAMFEQLMEYHHRHGHCRVAHTSSDYPELGRWVKRQRYQHKLWLEGNPKSTMTLERISKLEDIGFVWDSHGYAWQQRYKELQEFSMKHGHCNVPSNHPNKQLLSWIKFQRKRYKCVMMQQQRDPNVAGAAALHGNSSSDEESDVDELTLQRFRMLEALGFEWSRHEASH